LDAEPQFDVLVVGAGLSGVGAGCHLQARCPGLSYAILEARGDVGGTWDLFRYPGVRSDSDMHTLGYAFRPWRGAKAIADGPSILGYVRDTAAEHGVNRRIRFRHRVRRASWSSARARWTVEVERTDTGDAVRLTCGFLLMCSGYYSYAEGHAPDFPGADRFKGRIVHPQFWPEGLDHAGKRVVVVGSGATAVTIVPAMAEAAEHVTMLQRSPTYVVPLPSGDKVADWLRRRLGAELAHGIIRWKNVALGAFLYRLARRRPEQTKQRIVAMAQRALGPGCDAATHFAPRYKPWDQRLCVAPDADLFEAIRSGRASVATDHVEAFTEAGIRLRSGEELRADIVVTATGLKLSLLGGVELDVDGRRVALSETMAYKGTMLSGVPNLAAVFGYTNASWTLKADLTCEYVCRLLNRMRRRGYTAATPRRDPAVGEEPLLDFSSGYVRRALHTLPKQGARKPWRLRQNYALDLLALRFGAVDDGVLEFTPRCRRP
jgi:cation diffusion facilitator CzcD-associated flavoprotein CzcO